MPYISASRRSAIAGPIFTALKNIDTAGDLTYAITLLLHLSLTRRVGVPLNFDALHSVIGILECAKLEFYRTVVAHYEEAKIDVNGPVSALDDLEQEALI